MTYILSADTTNVQSPILLINQLRANKVPGKVVVSFRGKNLGDYEVSYVHMSTLQLRNIEPNRNSAPLYVPNPLHCPATFEASSDYRTFVTIRDNPCGEVIFNLVFHNLPKPVDTETLPTYTGVQDVSNQ